MSVIVSRALPDVRDGLKPVQRRILWAMHDSNLRPDRPFVKCRPRRRRRHGQLPPARRLRDLRRARAHGPVVLADRAAHRQARQLRVALRSARREPLHGVPPVAARDGVARRDRRGHRRLRPQLRLVARRAVRAARALPEPDRERFAGHRGRDGHQHPAAQSRRGVQRGAEADRQARRDAGRAHAHREGARLPDRRPDHGRRRHQGRVPHRPRNDPRARPARDRGRPARAARRSC